MRSLVKRVRSFSQGKPKQTLLVWLAVYPIITALAWALEPTLQSMLLPLRTLILSALMVPIMVFGAIPLINHFANKERS